ncbi:hypothetical protein RMCBS344292_14827 [Rhizopus microsporus]|nr:hypothetical protein RMCBS344292_14827 [Rhizopus microsporus]
MEEESISKLLLEIRNIEKTVNNINVQINNNLDDITKKKTLVEERQALKAIMRQENRSMLDKKKNIMECKNEKARLYESMFPSEDTIDMYQCSKTTHLSDSLGNMTFYCVDPGVRTMATCVQMNAEDTSSYLSLSLGHPDLLNFFKTEEGKARLNHLLKPCETTVTAKSISAKSRTSYYRFKLQQRKNSNSDIASIENKLAPYVGQDGKTEAKEDLKIRHTAPQPEK